jgi:hypothetical protein
VAGQIDGQRLDLGDLVAERVRRSTASVSLIGASRSASAA